MMSASWIYFDSALFIGIFPLTNANTLRYWYCVQELWWQKYIYLSFPSLLLLMTCNLSQTQNTVSMILMKVLTLHCCKFKFPWCLDLDIHALVVFPMSLLSIWTMKKYPIVNDRYSEYWKNKCEHGWKGEDWVHMYLKHINFTVWE